MRLHLGHSDPTAAGMFLQQAVEKFLKGFLLGRGWPLLRVHALPRLLDDAVTYEPALEPFRDLMRRVTVYYLGDRYPGFGRDRPTEQQVREDALEAVSFVAALFPDESLEAP